ncbi:MAG: prolipoprotein diacylglyceryl transferase [Chloroflexi bacterium]|nr:prolipoprotein diacylglyceryl transferase [Chloroflexota bacterium]
MIEIGIDPVVWKSGSLTITWHGLFSAAGIIIGVATAARLARKSNLSGDAVYSAALWAIPAGIIGARLLHVIDQFSYYSNRPDQMFALQEGGLSLLGGILGGLVAVGIFATVSRTPFGKLADAAAPGLLLGQVVGRLGDVFSGDQSGLVTNLPWGVIYSHPASLGRLPYASHPVAAYEILADLLLLGLLLMGRGRLKPAGSLFLLYLSAYALARFLLSFLRADSTALLGDITQSQFVALLMLGGSAIMWALVLLKARATPERPVRRFARRG